MLIIKDIPLKLEFIRAIDGRKFDLIEIQEAEKKDGDIPLLFHVSDKTETCYLNFKSVSHYPNTNKWINIFVDKDNNQFMFIGPFYYEKIKQEIITEQKKIKSI